MNFISKLLILSGVCLIGTIVVLVKSTICRNQVGICENAGKNIDIRLRESMASLEKAAMHIQSFIEHIHSRKH